MSFTEAFGGKKARIAIFQDDKANVISKEELIAQIQILIYSIEDLEWRMLVKDIFGTKLLNKDFECQEFLDDLINQNYSKIYNC